MAQDSTIKDVKVHEHQGKSYLKFVFLDDSTISIPVNRNDAGSIITVLQEQQDEKGILKA